jgi:alginate O-acetyltransferase complex protein AlgI
MVFSSLLFIYIFLPIFLFIYYITPSKYKNIPALIASYIFYAWGEPIFVFILLFSSFADYIISKLMCRINKRRALLVVSIILNVGLLIVFKYAGFFTTQLNLILNPLGAGSLSVPQIVLPLGISFFTFQKLSYIIDVYRKNVKPADNFIGYALYVSLFPQLIAGPIVRYHDVNKQIKNRNYSSEQFCSGLFRFIIGLAKKVLIANYVAVTSQTVFKYYESASSWQIWIGAIAFSIQIYFDFSGYSDMAIGLGRMMGFEFLENFNRPYTAKSISEFWRRWHISLCNWMSEYLYIPLGGNRKGKFRTYLNLWIVFLVSGFWHGASWIFVLWGAFHGTMLSAEKFIGKEKLNRIPAVFRNVFCLYLIVISFVIFNSTSINQLKVFLIKMHTVAFQDPSVTSLLWYRLLSTRTIAVFCFAILISIYPNKLWGKHVELWSRISAIKKYACALVLSIILFLLSTMSLVSNGYNPFIYFQF